MDLEKIDVGLYRTDPSHFEIDITRNPDSGSFGEVTFAVDQSTKKKCVIKKTKNKLNDEKILLYFNREVHILGIYSHPAIVPFIGFSIDNDNYGYIYLEEIEKGSLMKMIKQMQSQKKSFTKTQKYIISYGVALAMQFLHRYNCIHRDLKAENVLIDSHLYPYITDFGSSKEMFQNDINASNAIPTTPKSMAPELYDDEVMDEDDIENENIFPIDVYAYSIMLFELWANDQIYKNYKSVRKLLYDVCSGKREDIPSTIPENWKKLIEICWSQKPKDRPTFNDIVKMLQSSDYLTNDIDKNEVDKYEKFLKQKDEEFLQSRHLLKQLIPTYILSTELKNLRKTAVKSNLDDIYNYIVVQSASKYGKTDDLEVYKFSEKFLKIIDQDRQKYNDTNWKKKISIVEMCMAKSLSSLNHYKFCENYFRRSFNHGKILSAYYLAELMSCKLVKESQANEMIHLYEFASIKGIIEAQKKLPYIQFDQQLFKSKDNEKVINYIKAIRIKYGIDTNKDMNKSMEFMLKSADENYGPALIEISHELSKKKKYKEAEKYFKKASDADYPEGNFYYAVTLLKQKNKDFKTYLEKAIKNQIPDAIGLHGCLLENEGKTEEALEYLQMAANHGSFGAWICMGQMCENDSKRGDPGFYFEKAANCCHCLDEEGFSTPIEYQVFECKTCKKKICEGCAKHCHKGHDIIEVKSESYFKCECGTKDLEKKCTNEVNLNGNAYQHFFICLTCNKTNKQFICKSCAEKCHKDHKIIECGIHRGFCSCGKHLLPYNFQCQIYDDKK